MLKDTGLLDRFTSTTKSRLQRNLARGLGLPVAPELNRYDDNVTDPSHSVWLHHCGNCSDLGSALEDALTACSLPFRQTNIEELDAGESVNRVLCDITGIMSSPQLVDLWGFFKSIIPRIQPCGRVILIGRTPEGIRDAQWATSQRAVEGFVRCLAKELGKGITVQLIYVEEGAESLLASPLRYFFSPKSAYVTGQVVRVRKSHSIPMPEIEQMDSLKPLAGKVALITGVAHGIGRAIAEVLSRDGAVIIGVDKPSEQDVVDVLMKKLNGYSLLIDLLDPTAHMTICGYLSQHFQGVDIMVHNAGITADKRLRNMAKQQWQSVVAVNLRVVEMVIGRVLEQGLLKDGARTVCISSLCGIAGNVGQTNYATSKAGLIGLVESLSDEMLVRKATINAIAPAYIETQMTRHMPFISREIYRRMNSLGQGGVPMDVAEAVAWMVRPDSVGINGSCMRVCGQSLIGA